MSRLFKIFFVQNAQIFITYIWAGFDTFWTKNLFNILLILAKNYEIFKILLNSTGQKIFLKKCQKTAEIS